ncbi:MAG: hypothetical protein IPI06_07620 [Gammaproteobacteria bacterium]|nr:hypothetical protein [Gammaproteobacteria bacterium]
MKALAPALLLAALAAGPVQAACSYPKAPESIPDGNTATTEQMVAAKKAVESYNKEMESYLSCIKLEYDGAITKDGEKLSEARKKELEHMQVQKHNAAIDELEAVAARLNEQIRVFKAKNAKKG